MNAIQNMWANSRATVAKAAGYVSVTSGVCAATSILAFRQLAPWGSFCRILFWRGLYVNVHEMIRFENEPECSTVNMLYKTAVLTGSIAVLTGITWDALSERGQRMHED